MSFKFREFGSVTALSVLEATNAGVKALDADPARGTVPSSSDLPVGGVADSIMKLPMSCIATEMKAAELSVHMTPFDLKRLESYANNMLDYHVILDLLPAVGTFYFDKRLGAELRLSAVQSSILLALGLQRKTIEELEVRYPTILFGMMIKSSLHGDVIVRP